MLGSKEESLASIPKIHARLLSDSWPSKFTEVHICLFIHHLPVCSLVSPFVRLFVRACATALCCVSSFQSFSNSAAHSRACISFPPTWGKSLALILVRAASWHKAPGKVALEIAAFPSLGRADAICRQWDGGCKDGKGKLLDGIGCL